nr:ribonuclease H-like domain-containing protein [Tanacetum cinerariifolium]
MSNNKKKDERQKKSEKGSAKDVRIGGKCAPLFSKVRVRLAKNAVWVVHMNNIVRFRHSIPEARYNRVSLEAYETAEALSTAEELRLGVSIARRPGPDWPRPVRTETELVQNSKPRTGPKWYGPRNKSDLNTMSLDDLYNNFKIVEQEVRGTTSTNTSFQNMAFVSSPSPNSTSEVPTVFRVSTAYLEQIHEDDLEEMDLKWQLTLLNMRAKRFFQKTGKKITINGSDIVGYEKTMNQETTRRIVNVEDTSSKAMVAIDGAGFHWSYMADDEAPTNMAFMALSDTEELDEDDEVKSPPKKKRKNVKPSVNKARCKYHQRERMVNETNQSRVNHNATTFPKAMLTKTGLKPVNSVRPVNPKINFFKKTNTAKDSVNTARPNSAVLNAVRANKGKAIEDQGYFSSGCSRHMTGNISYLTDFKEFDGGYVSFGGGAKGGKITGKGTIITADESHILLKVPRKNNMYSVDMKNIVLKKDLTCLVAKATNDKLMLWHRRLGHINFKNINKLVKDNLVRGLPSKRFENDQTCVACLKGKQHDVPFKSKTQISISQPLFMLHMDLFGPISMSSIMHKKYCLVITDDFSRFTWNRVLVVKPHFKNPYDPFRGRTHALSFMRAFGCHVTILNTLDHLGKFDVDENLQIRFLENKPLIVGDGPKWLFDIDTLTESMNYVPVSAGTNFNDFAGKEASFAVGQSSMEEGSSPDYIFMPLWNDGSLFDSSPKDSDGANPNTDGPINTIRLSDDYFGANNDMRCFDGVERDISNLSTTYIVPTTPNTRINKDQSLDNVISDMQSGLQTRRMTVTINEQGFISAIYKEKTHVDLHTCLFSCFLSQKEPKRITNALKDPAWVEAMQEELMQFHLQKFWRTASVRTLDNGEIELNAIVDGQVKTATEASVRSHLKLADADGISTLPTTKIFQQLALMGYVTDFDKLTFQKDEAITKEMHDGLRRATTSASSLAATQASGTISKTPTKATPSGPSSLRTSLEEGTHLEMGRGRMIEELDKDENVNLVQSSEKGEAQETAKHRMEFSTASPETVNDETLAETLLNIKRSAAEYKKKGSMQKPDLPKKIKKKRERIQLSLDEELAQNLYA